jgi:hypothetical protein
MIVDASSTKAIVISLSQVIDFLIIFPNNSILIKLTILLFVSGSKELLCSILNKT